MLASVWEAQGCKPISIDMKQSEKLLNLMQIDKMYSRSLKWSSLLVVWRGLGQSWQPSCHRWPLHLLIRKSAHIQGIWIWYDIYYRNVGMMRMKRQHFILATGLMYPWIILLFSSMQCTVQIKLCFAPSRYMRWRWSSDGGLFYLCVCVCPPWERPDDASWHQAALLGEVM